MLIGKIIKLKRIEKELSQKELGVKIGCTKSYVSLIENDKTEMTEEMKEAISKVLNINFTQQSLLDEQEESCKVPFIVSSAGGGYELQESNCITMSKAELNGINCNNVVCTQIRGDSMTPEINDKDLLIIDTEKNPLIDGEIYVMNFENQLYCKQVLLNINQVILESFNPKYPPVTLQGQEKDKLNIIGRVICQIRKRV